MGALHEALEQLAGHHARSARVVEMRFFGGMSNEDIAIELRVTSRTVQNDWTLARGWLLQQLSDPEGRAP